MQYSSPGTTETLSYTIYLYERSSDFLISIALFNKKSKTIYLEANGETVQIAFANAICTVEDFSKSADNQVSNTCQHIHSKLLELVSDTNLNVGWTKGVAFGQEEIFYYPNSQIPAFIICIWRLENNHGYYVRLNVNDAFGEYKNYAVGSGAMANSALTDAAIHVCSKVHANNEQMYETELDSTVLNNFRLALAQILGFAQNTGEEMSAALLCRIETLTATELRV